MSTAGLCVSLVQIEEGSSADAAALPPVLALHAFCDVDPLLCAPAADPLRTVVTLQPYLQTEVKQQSRERTQFRHFMLHFLDHPLAFKRVPEPAKHRVRH